MGKRSQTKKDSFSKMLEKAKERLPSARRTICQGCFAPRNTLTVTPHKENFIWKKSEIRVSEETKVVEVKCKFCNEFRILSLSKFSYDVFLADFKTYSAFILLKDDKYNALVGTDEIIDVGSLLK